MRNSIRLSLCVFALITGGYTWLHAQGFGTRDASRLGAGISSPDESARKKVVGVGEHEPGGLAAGIASLDESVRKKAIEEFQASRTKTVTDLCSIVDQSNAGKYPEKTRAAAAYLLGVMRAPEAVVALSSTLVDPPLSTGRLVVSIPPPYESTSVIEDALYTIGLPSAPQMITNLRETDNDLVASRSLDVLSMISANSLKPVRAALDSALAQEKDEKVKARLTKAKELLDVR